jgi:hypothetical protein
MLAKVMPMNIEASAPFKLTADMAAVLRCGSNGLGYEVILLLLLLRLPSLLLFYSLQRLTTALEQMFVGYVKAYYDAARRPEALSSLCNCIRSQPQQPNNIAIVSVLCTTGSRN